MIILEVPLVAHMVYLVTMGILLLVALAIYVLQKYNKMQRSLEGATKNKKKSRPINWKVIDRFQKTYEDLVVFMAGKKDYYYCPAGDKVVLKNTDNYCFELPIDGKEPEDILVDVEEYYSNIGLKSAPSTMRNMLYIYNKKDDLQKIIRFNFSDERVEINLENA